MTLNKSTKRTSPATRKRNAEHHRKGHGYVKAYWPYLPIVAIVSFGVLLSSWIGHINQNVLGYATGISVSGLYDGTNAQRTANGLGKLALNATLNQAAQAKAADMAAKNYWSHNSPTGETPWSFITAAGYSYQTAGENLAYGFNTSDETITGWMNSPGHRANILNTSYTEVGFGIIDIPDYQGDGPQTLVVAMYASPYVVTTPVAETPTSTPATTTTTTTKQTNSETPVATTEPTTQESTPSTTNTAKQDTAVPVSSTTKNSTPTKDSSASKQVARVQVITSANVAWTQFALSMLVSVAVLVFLLRHSFAWHKFLIRGEKFVLHHPLLDIAVVAIATLGAILLQTSGVIR